MFANDLRKEWKLMWKSRIDDETRAEGIADKSYERLFVDRGLILYATKDYAPPDFREILTKHLTPEETDRVNPNPVNGGIRKFIKDHITHSRNMNYKTKLLEETRAELKKMKKNQQPKHGGKGWLHYSLPGQ